MKNNWLLYLAMILAMCLWGLSWTNGKLLGDYELPASLLMFWRFFISSLAMLPFLLYRRQSLRLDRSALLAVLSGGVLIALYNVFYFTGTRIGSAGVGGVLVTTLNPVLTFILVAMVSGHRPGRAELIGVILGLIGGTLILQVWVHGWEGLWRSGNIYFLACAGSWAFLTLVSSRTRTHMSSLVFSFWVYVVAALLSVFLVKPADLFVVFTLDQKFWWNMVSISFGAMAFATSVYFVATVRLGSTKASAFIFTVPVSAMFFSMLVLKERLEIFTLLGGTLSILAVYLINQSGRKHLATGGDRTD